MAHQSITSRVTISRRALQVSASTERGARELAEALATAADLSSESFFITTYCASHESDRNPTYVATIELVHKTGVFGGAGARLNETEAERVQDRMEARASELLRLRKIQLLILLTMEAVAPIMAEGWNPRNALAGEWDE